MLFGLCFVSNANSQNLLAPFPKELDRVAYFEQILMPYDSALNYTKDCRDDFLGCLINQIYRTRRMYPASIQGFDYSDIIEKGDTIKIVSLVVLSKSDCCDYYPMEFFPPRIKGKEGEIPDIRDSVPDYLLWPGNRVKNNKTYFLFERKN